MSTERKSSTSDNPYLEELFKQKLIELGIVKEFKDLSDLPEDNWVPIKAKGKPLSQIVIEERR